MIKKFILILKSYSLVERFTIISLILFAFTMVAYVIFYLPFVAIAIIAIFWLANYLANSIDKIALSYDNVERDEKTEELKARHGNLS